MSECVCVFKVMSHNYWLTITLAVDEVVQCDIVDINILVECEQYVVSCCILSAALKDVVVHALPCVYSCESAVYWDGVLSVPTDICR